MWQVTTATAVECICHGMAYAGFPVLGSELQPRIYIPLMRGILKEGDLTARFQQIGGQVHFSGGVLLQKPVAHLYRGLGLGGDGKGPAPCRGRSDLKEKSRA